MKQCYVSVIITTLIFSLLLSMAGCTTANQEIIDRLESEVEAKSREIDSLKQQLTQER